MPRNATFSLRSHRPPLHSHHLRSPLPVTHVSRIFFPRVPSPAPDSIDSYSRLTPFSPASAMADTTAAQNGDLKYLGLVHALVLQAAAYLATFYTYAKDSSGPLKPSVDNVEGTVKTVVGPVYQKVEGKPYQLLQYVDNKVDETLNYVDGVVPKFVKERSYQAYDVAKQAPDAARSVVADVQSRGVYSTASSYYDRYEPVAEQLTFEAWQMILSVPFVPQAVNVAAPAAKFGALQYNNIAKGLKSKNLPLVGLLPLVPIERIEEATKAATPAHADTAPSAPSAPAVSAQ